MLRLHKVRRLCRPQIASGPKLSRAPDTFRGCVCVCVWTIGFNSAPVDNKDAVYVLKKIQLFSILCICMEFDQTYLKDSGISKKLDFQ